MRGEPTLVTVDPRGAGDFRTIAEAAQATPYDVDTVILLRAGVYREKVFCEKKSLWLRGEGAERVRLSWGDGAYRPHADGRNTGTFRSYTLFLGGERVRVSGMTIENDAGYGPDTGQGMAVYADASRLWMEDVVLRGHQDTLFIAPLPERERMPDGFLGPRKLAPGRMSRQYYERCRIDGDVDFIFGGGDAVFDRCTLISRGRDGRLAGYIAAPSGKAEGLGFVFRRCDLVSDGSPGTVFLARPWRPEGKAAYLDCDLGGHIAPAGWSAWEAGGEERQCCFAEYGSTGPGSAFAAARAPWARRLTAEEAALLNERADAFVRHNKEAFA